MDLKLIKSNVIAIPLQEDETSSLNPKPNFLVIDNLGGRRRGNFLNFQTGEPERMPCSIITYKICFREILEPRTQDEEPEMIERILLPSENQLLPIRLLPFIESYESLFQNISVVNAILELFQFRGVLQGYSLQLDTDAVEDIIQTLLTEGIEY